jgi:hypothetical protein
MRRSTASRLLFHLNPVRPKIWEPKVPHCGDQVCRLSYYDVVHWFERVGLHWTEESEEHIAKHGIVPDEVEDVLYTRPRYVKPGRGGTTEAYGTTNAGRHVFVVLSGAMDGQAFVVTARDMTDDERRAFRKKRR